MATREEKIKGLRENFFHSLLHNAEALVRTIDCLPDDLQVPARVFKKQKDLDKVIQEYADASARASND